MNIRIIQSVFICLLGSIFALFRRLEQRMVPAAQVSFHVTPGPMNGPGGSTARLFGYSCNMFQLMLERGASGCPRSGKIPSQPDLPDAPLSARNLDAHHATPECRF